MPVSSQECILMFSDISEISRDANRLLSIENLQKYNLILPSSSKDLLVCYFARFRLSLFCFF